MKFLYSTAGTAVPLALLVLSPCVSSLAPTGSASLVLSTPISSTAPTISPNETLSSLFESNTGLEAAVKAWDDDERCDDHFFATNSEQMRNESNFAGFYNETIGHLRSADPDKFREFGEVGTFVQELLHEPNFVCSWQHNGCKIKPHCGEIVRRLNETSNHRGEQVSTAELLVLARQVYFVIETLDDIAGYWHSFSSMVNAVHSYAQAYAADVVTTFTEQQNPDDTRKCQIANFVQTFAIFAFKESFTVMSWATTALAGVDFGKLVDPLFEDLKNIGAKQFLAFLVDIKLPLIKVPGSKGKPGFFKVEPGFKPSDLTGPGTPKWMNNISPIADIASHVTDFAFMTYQLEMSKLLGNEAKKFDAAQDDNPSSGRLRMQNTPIFQTDICTFFGGGKKDENAARTSNMNVWLGKIFQALHGQASTFSDWLLNSKGDDMDEYDGWNVAPADWSTHLAAVLSRPDMYQATQRMFRHYEQYEKNMTQYFKETLVTAAWASAVCYNKCVRTSTVEEAQNFCKDNPLKIKYCPPDDELTMCQVQCFSRRELRSLEIDLHGMQQLQEYDINIEQVARDSYRHYILHRDKFITPAQSLGNDGMGMDHAINGTLSGIALPTCMSPDIKMGDYRNPTGLMNKYHQQFPFTCGEWSSDTYDFMEAMGLHRGGPSFTSGQLWAELQHIAPNNLYEMDPAEHYLAMCELGIKMPDTNAGRGDEWRHYARRIETWRNASPACETIKKELEPFMHDHDQANLHFCKRSLVVSDEVFMMERWHAENLTPNNWLLSGWDVVGKVIAHMTQCNTWLEKHHPEEGQIKWRWDKELKRSRYQ